MKGSFSIGDTVVYSDHGVLTVTGAERLEFDGEEHDYYVLRSVSEDLTARVPRESAVDVGVRPGISK